jgi:hypothetical protein
MNACVRACICVCMQALFTLTLKTPVVCELCKGTPLNAFTWTQAQWIQPEWVQNKWATREWEPSTNRLGA